MRRIIVSVAMGLGLACAAAACSSGPGPSEAPSERASALSQATWVFDNTCCDTIGVAPDNTLWCTSCSNHSVWYRRDNDSCGEFVCDPNWYRETRKATSISVDNCGVSKAILNGAVQIDGNGGVGKVAVPSNFTGPYAPLPIPSTCVTDIVQDHYDDCLVFHSPSFPISPPEHKYFALGCSADANGNYQLLYKDQEDFNPWSTLSMRAKRIALFSGVDNPRAQQLWTLDNQSQLARYDPSIGSFTRMPRPAFGQTTTYGITDHFALAMNGVYQWDDASQSWSKIIDSVTPTGRIKQITYAARVPAYVDNQRTLQSFGPSDLWATDESNTLYRLVWTTVIR